MIDLISTHGIQLGFGLIGALLVFVASYALPERWPIAILVLTLPFQLIASRYGTVNVGMVYLTFLAFFFQGRVRELPYLVPLCLIAFAYLLSLSLSIPSTWLRQVIYLFNIFSGFALFYLVFNHFRRYPDPRFALGLLVALNTLVLAFFTAQLTIGFNEVTVAGVSEWTIGGNLEAKSRLLGPFGPAGPNAGYLVLQVLIIGYALLRSSGLVLRLFLVALIFGNLAMLVATGSRGGFLALLFGVLLFLVAFRRQLGVMRVLGVVTVGGAGFVVAAALIILFTPFNQLFERLAGTEFEGVVPDSRSGWFLVIERIPERLWFGHGPRIVMDNMSPRFLREVFIGFPHNLYLFLLYSLGVTGFIAWMTWFASLALHWLRAARWELAPEPAAEFPRLGVVVLLTFLFDSMKIEFLRFQVVDYQHYQFTFWAMTAAFAVHALQRHRQPAPLPARPPMPVTRPDPFAPAGAPVMLARPAPGRAPPLAPRPE